MAALASRAKPERALSVDDFVRAASDEPSAEANGGSAAKAAGAARVQYDSHAGDDGGRPPAQSAVQSAATPDVQVKAPDALGAESIAAVKQRPVAPTRIEGFGAEGVPAPASPKASARELAGSKRTVIPRPIPLTSAAEQAEITEEAVKPMVLPGLYSRTGRLIVPAPLKGSHEILVHQNFMADQAGLERIQDDAMLNRLRASHQLVTFPESSVLRVNPELPSNRRYARPWAVEFAVDLSRQFYMRFHQPLQVNSAVRTAEYQLRLQRINSNAAPVDGDVASPHLTGEAVDFGKRGMSITQIAWMRAYLLPLITAGKIDVEEEFQQACFHISVYHSYTPQSRLLARVENAPSANEISAARRATEASAIANPVTPGGAEPDR